MTINKDTIFWDTSYTIKERLDWLINELTVEEKLGCLGSTVPDIERLGIPGFSVGGEAAHGVEARNDQNGIGVPVTTTSFPQPIGMSASWDKELIEKAGEITGTEARAVYHEYPKGGLSRWAPTVDLERDPRWGRNEEGYGEDPLLTGEMAGHYIRGMQGTSDKYLRIAATLKHFYGNNTESGRCWKNSSIDPRNRYELYLEPFRRCIEDYGAEAVMTAYNKINGVPGILNPEVDNILKKQYGLHHVVGDGGAMSLVKTIHHSFGQHSKTIAAALKAGVDAMSDPPEMVKTAAADAYKYGLITEEDMDRAIKNTFRTKLRLGIYDRVNANPYDKVTKEDLCSEKAVKVCQKISDEAVVLLKNDGILPLNPGNEVSKTAVIGSMADAWYQDWYGGHAPYQKTLVDGIEEVIGSRPEYADGLDRVAFYCKGKAIAISDDGTLCLADEPDVFIKENWGEGSYTFKSVRTGKYMNMRFPIPGHEDLEKGRIAVDKEAAFDWFVLEIFHMEKVDGDSVILFDRFHYPLSLREDGAFISMQECDGTPVTMKIVENGIDRALKLAKNKQQIILALGCNPMINAKEEIDRNDIELPPDQVRLMDSICKVCKNTVLALFTNYPYDLKKAVNSTSAIIMSATGSQEMGGSMARAIYGISAPAGRLNMTWYDSILDIPDINDYDIIKGKRTYRYFDKKVLFPFGYGLTYSQFEYSDFKVELLDSSMMRAHLKITNSGKIMSDEVVQIYGTAPKSRVAKPLKQLLWFDRLHDVKPGETVEIDCSIPVKEFRFHDVISDSFMVEEGEYTLFAGDSSLDEQVSACINISGASTGVRDLSGIIVADHYDEYENVIINTGDLGYAGVETLDKKLAGRLIFKDCQWQPEYSRISLHFISPGSSKIDIYINDILAGEFEGDTLTCEPEGNPSPDRYAKLEIEERNKYRVPQYEDIAVNLENIGLKKESVKVELKFHGDMKLCYFTMLS